MKYETILPINYIFRSTGGRTMGGEKQDQCHTTTIRSDMLPDLHIGVAKPCAVF